jgi:cyclophilin family peptidyl-prolyl cis-trans isomerase
VSFLVESGEVITATMYLGAKLSGGKSSSLQRSISSPPMPSCSTLPPMKISRRHLLHSVTTSALVVGLAACGSKESTVPAPSSTAAQPPEDPKDPIVVIKTSMGDIRAELFAEKAPKTVANFLSYVDKKHYDNTIFHRVMSDFMIQGGGFENQNGNFVEKATDPPVPNEAHNGLKNHRGTLAMARTSDPHSATSQFFINVVENGPTLDLSAQNPGYAVFGKVLSGMDIVDQIRVVPVTTSQLTSRLPSGQLQPGPNENVPIKAVNILSITKESAAK